MCGIVGYIGENKARPVLMNGIRRLEYRGYDSAGISIINDNKMVSERSVGFVDELEKKLNGKFDEGTLGIVHTRWATHGAPTVENAHPHCDCTGNISIVHNGIIENSIAKFLNEGERIEDERSKTEGWSMQNAVALSSAIGLLTIATALVGVHASYEIKKAKRYRRTQMFCWIALFSRGLIIFGPSLILIAMILTMLDREDFEDFDTEED